MQTRLLPLVILLTASFAGTAVAAQKCRDDIPADTHPSQFVVGTDADGTPIVTDNTTGLVWQRCALGYTGPNCTQSSQYPHYSWLQALDAVKAHPGWRLPNVKELYSLVDHRCTYPAIDLTVFPNTQVLGYISSSPALGHTIYVWEVHFGHGRVLSDARKSAPFEVRLVRDAK